MVDEGIRKESKDATRGWSKYEDIQGICGGEGWERGDQEGRKAIRKKERSFSRRKAKGVNQSETGRYSMEEGLYWEKARECRD
jgi:hypothetical protein